MNRWYVILMVLSLASCKLDFGGDPNEEGQNDLSNLEKDKSANEEVMDVLLVNVDQLRLRRYGDVKSEMLTTLDENAPLYFTGEETDYQETIGGHKGPWKRVRTLDGAVEGWIFGAEYFAETWLSKKVILEHRSEGKEVKLFSNMSTKELADLTGANFNASPRGSRYTGYYTYKSDDPAKTIDGTVVMRARLFNPSSREVKFVPCTLEVRDGMPTQAPQCEE